MSRNDQDLLGRYSTPDVNPRLKQPTVLVRRYGQQSAPGAPVVPDIIQDLTVPGVRPFSYQAALNVVTVATPAGVPLVPNKFECDAIMLNVISGTAQSAFWGWGSGINFAAGNGQELRPGIPVFMDAGNTREQWELQRCLEAIANILSEERGGLPIGPYKAPRVVFNAADYYVTASVNTTVRVMLFYTPEGQ
jgi:hypothetical protein